MITKEPIEIYRNSIKTLIDIKQSFLDGRKTYSEYDEGIIEGLNIALEKLDFLLSYKFNKQGRKLQ